MLFNPKWFKPQKIDVDPFELATLIAWLERQDPESWYDYRNCYDCLLACYFHDHGWENAELSKNFVLDKGRGVCSVSQQAMLPEFFNWIAEDNPHSYGGALRRAKLVRDDRQQAVKARFQLSCYGGD